MKFTKIFIFVLFLLVSTHPVLAAKLRVRKSTGGSVASGVAYSSARLSRATNSIIATFLNLNRVSKIRYTLNYTSNGISQGVVGSLVVSGQTSDSRDLYFGTCSHGVCTPHYNIRNASLLIQTTLTTGGVHTKRYKIRI
ncbi:hypothetical protein A3A79_03110 [Candidatus Gottesmanbacteria bacterium RIFCSPLOWO2_01_FULL_43_11b]|uniref:Uncharacterized protein n=1 Tax=Candidatus Gottesmanbacteria bacterium RIFCSPLOWO2_01_FULL_43_11b TaxID=1798392 RepID=A0A1F6AHI4_9BACT|nr:MAG: hypothetical protein A3A79_03110 [Candidatus Gottesmanbacteria bacterium RIFCSPLOWO2_01_FULL_43_11b]